MYAKTLRCYNYFFVYRYCKINPIQNAGIEIVINFENGEGITVGKTRVMYRGIPVGMVRAINVNRDLDSIALTVEMDKMVKEGLVEDTIFWIVKPEVSAGRISGLDTLVSGSYIEAQRGQSKVSCREFTGLSESPGEPENASGLHLKLQAAALGSIQKDSKIYYNNIEVGSVQRYVLTADENVLIDAFIKPEYQHLIRESTRFWNSSGISIKGNLSGFKLRMESMANLIYGGINLYTPEEKKGSPLAKNGDLFILHEDFDAAEYGLKMTLHLPSARGLTKDVSKVMYRGFVVGVVTDFTFNKDEKRTVTASILLDPEAEFALREQTQFWVVQPTFSVNRVENLETIIRGAHITFHPGEGDFRNHFEAVEQPLAEEILQSGAKFTLISKEFDSFSIGAPVLFKKMKVGEIIAYDLGAAGKHIEVEIFIYEQYANLVHFGSVFWKIGGIKLDAGLARGIKVDTGTLSSLIAGGVAFGDGDLTKQGKNTAQEETSFVLYESYHEVTEAIPSLKPKGRYLKIRAKDGKYLSVGSPVLFKYIEVGEITAISLVEGQQEILLEVFIEEKYEYLLQATSRFYNVSGFSVNGDLGGIKITTGSVKSILMGGIAFLNPDPKGVGVASTPYSLYKDRQEALEVDKTKITIHFNKPKGIKEGLEIKYRGIRVGEIGRLRYGSKLDVVVAEILVDREAQQLFRTDSRVWLVTPKFGISGISNLDTIIGGSYLTIIPGEGSLCVELEAQDSPPSLLDSSPDSLNIVLRAATLGSLKPNSPVYYRQVLVGQVRGYDLAATGQEVLVYLTIDKPYGSLVRQNTVFWNAGGIKFDAGFFSGIKLKTESLEAVIVGGVALATPEGEAMGEPVEDGYQFTLHGKMKEEWGTWKPELDLETY